MTSCIICASHRGELPRRLLLSAWVAAFFCWRPYSFCWLHLCHSQAVYITHSVRCRASLAVPLFCGDAIFVSVVYIAHGCESNSYSCVHRSWMREQPGLFFFSIELLVTACFASVIELPAIEHSFSLSSIYCLPLVVLLLLKLMIVDLILASSFAAARNSWLFVLCFWLCSEHCCYRLLQSLSIGFI